MSIPYRPNHTLVKLQQRLCDLLLERNVLERHRLDELRDMASGLKQPIEKILMTDDASLDGQVLAVCSEVSGLPILKETHIEPDHAMLQLVSMRVATGYHVLPVRLERGVLTLATDHFREADEEDQLRVLLGCSIRWTLCSPETLNSYIRHFYGVGVQRLLNMQAPGSRHARDRRVDSASPASVEAEIPSLIKEIIHDAIGVKASDIHLESKTGRVWLRYRIDGVLYTMQVPEDIHPHLKAIISSIKIMAQMNIAERRLPQDGRFSVDAKGETFDVRVSVLPSDEGESVNMRILNRQARFMKLDELALPPTQRQKLEQLLQQPYGIILFTGPTGCGKTTSLYAALDYLNNSERKIITIEDPIEYRIAGITQMQVNPEIGFTFATGLRSVLRHDPDVVLIGEIRDEETADIAISSALTGHLVFSTLHTNDSVSAVTRLNEMGVPHYLTAAGLLGVVAQRLVRRLCQVCREEHAPGPEVVDELRELFPERKDYPPFYRKAGCPRCRFTGYSGRQAVYEILVMNDTLSPLVAAGATASQLMEAVQGTDFQTLRENVWDMVFAGTTSIDELMRITKRNIRK